MTNAERAREIVKDFTDTYYVAPNFNDKALVARIAAALDAVERDTAARQG